MAEFDTSGLGKSAAAAFAKVEREGETPAETAASKQLALQERALGQSDELMERQLAISEEQIGIARNQEERSQALWDTYKEHYLPGEISFSKELFAGVRPDLAVDRAVSDVQRQFGNVLRQQSQSLRSMGINPASPRAQSEKTNLLRGLASARAGAANTARGQTMDLNRALKSQAVAQGQRLPGLSSNISTAGAGILGQAGAGQLQAGSVKTGLLSNFAGQAATATQNELNREFMIKQTALQQAEADRQRRSSERSQLFNTVANVGGMLVGGAPGAAVGSQLFGGGGGGASPFGGGSPAATSNFSGGMNINPYFQGTDLSLG